MQGGKREGAGRPRVFKDTRKITFTLPSESIDKLIMISQKEGITQAQLVRSLIDEKYKATF